MEGNIGAIFGRILDVYWLSEGEHDKIRDPFIQSFESLEALEIYARDLDDFQLTGMIKVVREYARILPDAVYDMMKVSKSIAKAPNGRGIILSTVHGAKGQEYDRVYIDPDVAASLSRPGGASASEFGDEANIAYVAFTRAIRELYLPQDFKNILTPEWQEAIKRYEPIRVLKTSQTPLRKYSRKRSRIYADTQSDELTTKVPLPEPPHEKPFNIGDRVKTSHGTGIVVKVERDKYLVDLDGQEAQLWEKAWSLRKG